MRAFLMWITNFERVYLGRRYTNKGFSLPLSLNHATQNPISDLFYFCSRPAQWASSIVFTSLCSDSSIRNSPNHEPTGRTESVGRARGTVAVEDFQAGRGADCHPDGGKQ
jgi:hypothetical protein